MLDRKDSAVNLPHVIRIIVLMLELNGLPKCDLSLSATYVPCIPRYMDRELGIKSSGENRAGSGFKWRRKYTI